MEQFDQIPGMPQRHWKRMIILGWIKRTNSGNPLYEFDPNFGHTTYDVFVANNLGIINSIPSTEIIGFMNSVRIALAYQRLPDVDANLQDRYEYFMAIPDMRLDVATALIKLESNIPSRTVTSYPSFDSLYEDVLDQFEVQPEEIEDVMMAVWNAFIEGWFRDTYKLQPFDVTPPWVFKGGPWVFKGGPWVFKGGPWVFKGGP